MLDFSKMNASILNFISIRRSQINMTLAVTLAYALVVALPLVFPLFAKSAQIAQNSQSAQSTDLPLKQNSKTNNTTPNSANSCPQVFQANTSVGLGSQNTVQSFEELKKISFQSGKIYELKFVLNLTGANQAKIDLLDSNFYDFHDEWFWYQLLNGVALPEVSTPPLTGLNFKNVSEAKAYLKKLKSLPLGLSQEGDLIFSPEFHDLMMKNPPSYAAGTLYVKILETGKYELGLDLEYANSVSSKLFNTIEASLKQALSFLNGQSWSYLQTASLKKNLDESIPKTEKQKFLAQSQWIVYGPGATAGRLKLVSEKGLLPTEIQPTDILVVESPEMLGSLPPVAGIIYLKPTSALSHVNMLARSRNLPVAVAPADRKRELVQLALRNRPHLFRVGGNRNDLESITDQDFAEYLKILNAVKPKPQVSNPKLNGAYFVDLNKLANAPKLNRGALSQQIGGKALGATFLMKIKTPGIESAVSLTTRSYFEHLAQTLPSLERVLLSDSFQQDAQVRILVLEGEKSSANRYGIKLDEVLKSRGSLEPEVLDVIKAGGVQDILRAAEISPNLMTSLNKQLDQKFGTDLNYSLRFRSSGTSEDTDLTNAAGVYTSEAGFRNPQNQSDPKVQKKSFQWAIKKVWASYWSYEAYQEREKLGISHFGNGMGVLIHSRFKNDVELANGVATITLTRQSAHQGEFSNPWIMDLSALPGSISVVSPEAQAPSNQIVQIIGERNGQSRVVKNELSQLDGKAVEVLTVQEIDSLQKEISRIAEEWRRVFPQLLTPEQTAESVTLDLEFKKIKTATGPRLIIKQVRPLKIVSNYNRSLLNKPFPRDMYDEAMVIQERRLNGAAGGLKILELYRSQDRYDQPFTGSIHIDLSQQKDDSVSQSIDLTHLDFSSIGHGFMHHGPWDIQLELTEDAQKRTGIRGIDGYESGVNISLVNGQDIRLDFNKNELQPLITSPEYWVSQKLKKLDELKMPGGGISIGIGVGIGVGPKIGIGPRI